MMSYLVSVFSFLATNLHYSFLLLCSNGVQGVIFYYVINRVDFLRIFGYPEPVSRQCCIQRLQLAKWLKLLIMAIISLIVVLLFHALYSEILWGIPTTLASVGVIGVMGFVFLMLTIGFSVKRPINGFHIGRFKIYIQKHGDRLVADVHDRKLNLPTNKFHSEGLKCVAQLLAMNFDEITMESHLLGRYRTAGKQRFINRWLMKKMANFNVQASLGPLKKTGVVEWLTIYFVTKFSGKGAPCKMKRRLTIMRCSQGARTHPSVT